MRDYEECSKCGRQLKRGELKYLLYISIVSDFDGVIPVDDRVDVEQIMDEASRFSEEELENDVYEEMAFLLCKSCRDKFRRDPLNVFSDSDTIIKKNGRSFN